MSRVVRVAGGRFAPGHLGELTRIVSFDLVDAAITEAGKAQKRVRDLPARVVVYLLLAGALFPALGYPLVWAKLVGGLDGLRVGSPTASALRQARARLGPEPIRALFELLRGPAAEPSRRGVWWWGRLVVAIDGTQLGVADEARNLMIYRKSGCNHGTTGYPLLRLVALVGCGTRTVIDAVFGPATSGETVYAAELVRSLRAGMILLADRNFASRTLVTAIAETGADLLVRVKNGRRLPACRRLGDGSWISRIGPVEVRVVRCEITIATTAGGRTGVYQLVTTVTDPAVPTAELIRLYHDRWKIETVYLELKTTILGGRVLRARTPAGVEQEVYALLCAYQALRLAIADATLATPNLDPDRASFTIALETARDQLVHAAGVIADSVIDLVGTIGRAVLARPMPDRRLRVSPRVVKRAISNYAASTRKGRIHGPSYKATLVRHEAPLLRTGVKDLCLWPVAAGR
ncbi:IS4 family transposase [Parafrankia sp. FMc6]|uniref:IS4 family transposase n=1 Tax=Parafrankia soli TaxID=2599596 RepID=UPI0034D5C98E